MHRTRGTGNRGNQPATVGPRRASIPGLVEGRGADLLIKKLLTLVATVAAAMALTASPAMAIVGGDDAEPGEYPAVAEITFGPFMCTGTLIAPDWVLSAGHCGSVTGAAVASPVSWPAALIDVRIGGLHSGEGEQVPVQQVFLNPNYLLTSGY